MTKQLYRNNPGRRNLKIFFFYFLIIYSFIVPEVYADMVYLKTGKVLENSKIIEASASKVIIEHEGKEKVYSMDEIIRLRYNQNILESINILLTDETLLNGYLVEQDVENVIFRRDKHSANEEDILKKNIKQMSNKEILLFYPEIMLSAGGLQILNSGGSKLGASFLFLGGYYINPPWFKKIKMGIDLGYGVSKNKEFLEQSFTFIPAFLTFQYLIKSEGMEKLSNSLTFAERFSYAPHIGIGASFIIFKDGEGETLQSLLPSVKAGFTLYFTVLPRLLFLNLSLDYYGIYEKKAQFHGAMTNLSMQYRY